MEQHRNLERTLAPAAPYLAGLAAAYAALSSLVWLAGELAGWLWTRCWPPSNGATVWPELTEDELRRVLPELEDWAAWARVACRRLDDVLRECTAKPDALRTSTISGWVFASGAAPPGRDAQARRLARVVVGDYIARDLAGRHGGRVEMEWSVRGAGSRFAAFLPLLEGPTSPEPEEDGEEEASEDSEELAQLT